MAGTVSNETGQAAAGLDVQLLASPARFSTRDQMDQYASQGTGASLQPVGSLVDIAASLKPGATAKWRASFQVNVVGITEFGVYPVTAQLVDMAGDVLASDPTLLPFWPGQQAAGLLRPLDIGWTWPLIDQPHHQVCSALTNSDLTGSLGTGRPALGPADRRAGQSWRGPDLGDRPRAAERRRHDDQGLPGRFRLRLQRPGR